MVNNTSPTLAEIIPAIVTDDGFGNLAIRTVVASENVPPTNILLSITEISEGEPLGTRIGRLSVVDPNADDAHVLEIVDDPDDKFAIENPDTSTGLDTFLVVKNELDYREKDSHEVTIKATDTTNLSVQIKFTITVTADFDNYESIDSNGIDEYQTGGDIHNYDITDAFSISMWVKPANIASTMILFSKATQDSSVNGYMLRSNATTGQLYLQMRSGSNRSHTFDTALTAVEWQHIVFTYSGAANISGASIYRNTVKNTTAPSGGLSGTMLDGQPFYLGQRNNTFGFYNGLMDEVSVWNKELSLAEVTEIYNEGVPKGLDEHSAVSSIASWYRYDGDIIPDITDYIGSDDLTAVNMDQTNITSDTP